MRPLGDEVVATVAGLLPQLGVGVVLVVAVHDRVVQVAEVARPDPRVRLARDDGLLPDLLVDEVVGRAAAKRDGADGRAGQLHLRGLVVVVLRRQAQCHAQNQEEDDEEGQAAPEHFALLEILPGEGATPTAALQERGRVVLVAALEAEGAHVVISVSGALVIHLVLVAAITTDPRKRLISATT
eukprot:scaffold588_cov247-Pinguiococcus_pyrenoidosus.AAC.7